MGLKIQLSGDPGFVNGLRFQLDKVIDSLRVAHLIGTDRGSFPIKLLRRIVTLTNTITVSRLTNIFGF